MLGYLGTIFFVCMLCSSGGSNELSQWCTSGKGKQIRRVSIMNTNYFKS